MYKKYWSFVFLSIVILLCMGGTLWGMGGILRLDYVATPFGKVDFLQNAWFLIPQIFVSLLGFDWGTKFVFFAILFLAGSLGILLARSLSDRLYQGKSVFLEVIGALFFVMNPFAYERMIVQPVIYLSIILLGYIVYFLLFHKKWTRWIWIGFCAGLAFDCSLHTSYMTLLIIGVYMGVFARNMGKSDISGIFLVGALVILINLHWLLAPFLGTHTVVSGVNDFTLANFEAFQTHAIAPLNVWWTNLFLYGFWGEFHGNNVSLSFLSSFWYIAGFLVLMVGLIGISFGIKKAGIFRNIVLYLGVLSGISLIFALGIASPLTRWLTLVMVEYVPFWQGYREPQKWIGIFMIALAIFFLISVGYLLWKWKKNPVKKCITLLVAISLIMVWSPGPLGSYHGQLKNVTYPQEFSLLRASLLSDSGNHSGQIVTFPWHSYIACGWTQKIVISNPIQGLLAGLPVVSADNIEVGTVLYSNSKNPLSMKVEEFLKTHSLRSLGGADIRGILLMKQCADARGYTWLDDVPECRVVSENNIFAYYQCHP